MEIRTKYFIDFVYPIDAYGNQSFYYQLVRTKDNAILFASEKLENVQLYCWKNDINHKDVTTL